MIAHFSAVTVSIAIYIFIGIAYLGWGKITLRIFKFYDNLEPVSLTLAIWLGWAGSLFILQVIHLFFPINALIVFPLLVIGMLYGVQWLFQRSVINIFFPFSFWIIFVITTLLVSAWLSTKAMLAPTLSDSGLYHFNAIRWINTYPIIPGLGNLHGRLAFNQSYFVYVSSLNFFPLFNHGSSIANTFIVILCIFTALPSVQQLKKPLQLMTSWHPFCYLPGLFALPIFCYLVLPWNGLSAPSPDLTSTILQLAMFIVFSQFIGEWISGRHVFRYKIFILIVLAGTSITIKMSNLAFSSAIIGIIFIYLLQNSVNIFRDSIKFYFPIFLIIIIWAIRGFILSGAPFYPSTFGYLPVDWAVPYEKIVEEADLVYSWARQPRTHWNIVLANWNWVEPWFEGILKHTVDVVYPMGIFIGFLIINLIIIVISFSCKRNNAPILNWIIMLPPILGIIFWFFTAPDPRFATASFFLAAISSSIILISSLYEKLNRKKFVLATITIYVLCNINLFGYVILNKNRIKSISGTGWKIVKSVALEKRETLYGLSVYTPADGFQCWDSPLPCTPHFEFNPLLSERQKGDVAKGFKIGKKLDPITN